MSEGRYYFRFNLYHRILHGMVMVSFLGLALTGAVAWTEKRLTPGGRK